MSRRLLGPVGGSIIFCFVAALVFAGLGWVTYAALGVEQAQREAHARAEMGYNLRIALRQLDSRMLPTLGVEDSRPFYHYSPSDPAATPLLGANLPDWMILHFQLDSANGWCSPQVIDDAKIVEQVRRAWPADVPLLRLNGSRIEFLKSDLKAKFPAETTCELFAQRDQAIPADSGPFVIPQYGEVVPQQSEPTPITVPQSQATPNLQPLPPNGDPVSGLPPITTDPHDTIRVLGFEFCRRDDQLASNQVTMNDLHQDAQNGLYAQKKNSDQSLALSPRPTPPTTNSMNLRGPTRGGQRDLDNNQNWLDYMTRAGTVGKAMQEAKLAANDPINPTGRGGPSQSQQGPALDQKNYGNSTYFPGNTFKNNEGNTLPALPLTGGVPGIGPQGVPPGPAPVLPGGPTPVGPPIATPNAPMGPGTGGGFSLNKDEKDKATKDRDLALGKPQENDTKALGSLVAEVASALRLEREKCDALKAAEGDRIKSKQALGHSPEAGSWFMRAREELLFRRATAEASKGTLAPMVPADGMTQPIPPPASTPPGEGPGPVPVAAAAGTMPPQAAIHLGSMRPQWLTAPDGTEMLVLVRTAKYDGKTIYQGVILDWLKLQAALKDEVKDLFPDATLVAVKDPEDVSPDRAMTVLPVQLDVGPEQKLPPAGWTPLRIGLVLAWVAAIIAFAAVGLSGWSLIDLAERRIRFVSAVTHELRTPLTSLRLYLDLLVSGMIQDEGKKQEYLNTLALESDRLHRLIDNVLDFAKLEKRRNNGAIKPVRVSELLDQLRATWTDRVAQDGKELVVISTLTAEQEVRTDSAMVQQIVANLIDNARKYTRDAADKRIWLWAKPGHGKSALLEVEDRGVGVPPNERRSIFKPFRRGELAESTAGGAGLGLALAKSWAEVLGATLSYRPADGGVGACFRLELPGK